VVSGIEAKGGKAIAIQADVSVVAEIRRLFRETIAKFGHVDIVVKNADLEVVPRDPSRRSPKRSSIQSFRVSRVGRVS
jgi:NAD(P)-dependent dehydrogenase (short-subunit alcohol dehydrogenase family)